MKLALVIYLWHPKTKVKLTRLEGIFHGTLGEGGVGFCINSKGIHTAIHLTMLVLLHI